MTTKPKKQKPNQPYFISWPSEVAHRKAWTVRGVYLTPKVQGFLEELLPQVIAFEESVDMLEHVWKLRAPTTCSLNRKGILKQAGPARYPGDFLGNRFTPSGLEVFNIWRGRRALVPDHTRVIVNGQEVLLPYAFTKIT